MEYKKYLKSARYISKVKEFINSTSIVIVQICMQLCYHARSLSVEIASCMRFYECWQSAHLSVCVWSLFVAVMTTLCDVSLAAFTRPSLSQSVHDKCLNYHVVDRYYITRPLHCNRIHIFC